MTTAIRRLGTAAGLPVALCLVGACSAAPRGDDQTAPAAGRRMFSPDVHGDPYARTQWEVSVQALEQECRRSGRMCDEAAQARIAISRRQGRT